MAPGSTQCAAVSTRSGASATPEQKLPREPTINTTARAISGGAAAAPPTIAPAGIDKVSSAERASRARMYLHEPREVRACQRGERQSGDRRFAGARAPRRSVNQRAVPGVPESYPAGELLFSSGEPDTRHQRRVDRHGADDFN